MTPTLSTREKVRMVVAAWPLRSQHTTMEVARAVGASYAEKVKHHLERLTIEGEVIQHRGRRVNGVLIKWSRKAKKGAKR
jgi:hypothetical protein